MAQVIRLVYQREERRFVPVYTVLGEVGNLAVRPQRQEWAHAVGRIEEALNRRTPRQRSGSVRQAARAEPAPR